MSISRRSHTAFLYLTYLLVCLGAVLIATALAQNDIPPFSPSMSAREAHQAAIKIVSQEIVGRDEVNKALPYFEHCAKLEPRTASFQNNVGVTYMRLSKWPEAHRAFLRAASIDSMAQDWFDNLKELSNYYKSIPLDPVTARVVGGLPNIPEIEPWEGYPNLTNDGSDPDDFHDDDFPTPNVIKPLTPPSQHTAKRIQEDSDDIDPDDFDFTETTKSKVVSSSPRPVTPPAQDNTPLKAVKLGDQDVKAALNIITRAYATNLGIPENAVVLDDDDDDFVSKSLEKIQLDLTAHNDIADQARRTLLRAAALNGYEVTDINAAVKRQLIDEFREFLGRKLTAVVKQSQPTPVKKPKANVQAPTPHVAVVDESALSPTQRKALRLSRVNTNPRTPFPRIHINELSKPENAVYLAGRLPYILVGALDADGDIEAGNKKRAALFIPEMFAREFPDEMADFYPSNMDKLKVHPFMTPMSRAISEFVNPSGDFPKNEIVPGSYIQFNMLDHAWQKMRTIVKFPPRFEEDLDWLSSCLGTKELVDEFTRKLHWRMTLIGSIGAGMFNHHDVLRTSSWQAQLTGGKKWHICAPNQRPYLYGAGLVDCFHPDYEKYPLFKYARCWEGVVNAGEMVFYPRDYWHQTENTHTPSVAISASILDAYSYNEIREELIAECRFKRYNWKFSPELCAALTNQCYPQWEKRFGGKFASLEEENRAHHSKQLAYDVSA